MFEKNWDQYQSKEHRIIINEGGTGSSKTVSLAQLFATILTKERGIQLTIARKTMPSLRATAMKDFFRVVKGLGIYKEENHNKSENIFKYNNNEVDFLSVDEPMRVRSRRRQYLWMNEANEFNREDYRQLSMRTDGQIFMDYNPSHQYHWIYDDVQPRKDCVVIPSTYKDNPFLPKDLVKEIESYQGLDQNYWRVYGLGLRGVATTTIYTHWKYCNELPNITDETVFGLDFGYNNETAFVEVSIKDKKYYWRELLYKRFLTNTDLIEELNNINTIYGIGNKPIYADNQEPQRIEELVRAGFNVIPCFKGKVKDGIDFIKANPFYITKDSVNLLKEVKFYSWKEINEKPIDEPVKEKDHLMDAGRYAVFSHDKTKAGSLPYSDSDEDMAGFTGGIMDQSF